MWAAVTFTVYAPEGLVDDFAWINLGEDQDPPINSLELADRLATAGPLNQSWSPLEVWVSDMRKTSPDIWYPNFGDAEFVVTDEVREAIEADCDTAWGVEFLPLRCSDVNQPLWLLRATNWPNVLDLSKTTYTARNMLSAAAFLPERLGDWSLFKVSRLRDSAAGEMLALERSDEPGMGFKALVERNGFSGLKFREVWSTDGGPRPFQRLLGG